MVKGLVFNGIKRGACYIMLEVKKQNTTVKGCVLIYDKNRQFTSKGITFGCRNNY